MQFRVTMGCLLCLMGCAAADEDAGHSASIPHEDTCELPETYVARFVELEGNCGPRPSRVFKRADSTGPGDPNCETDADNTLCIRSGTEQCTEKLGLTTRAWFLEGTGRTWVGEESVSILGADGSSCTSRYSLTLTPT